MDTEKNSNGIIAVSEIGLQVLLQFGTGRGLKENVILSFPVDKDRCICSFGEYSTGRKGGREGGDI